MPDSVRLLADELAELAFESLMARTPRLWPSIARLYSVPEGGYDYSHHASLGVWKGRLHAFWSNGSNGEDRPGQVQRWASRGGDGRWSDVRLLAQSPMNAEHSPEATTCTNGGTAVGTSRLVSFYSECKGTGPDHPGSDSKWVAPMVTGVQVHDDARDAWEHLGIVLEDYLLNEGPRRTAGGRWIMTGEDHYGRTRIALSDADDPAAPVWRAVSVPRGEGPRYKNEASWLQRPDGTLALFLRDDGRTHRLWLSTSADEGETWSTPLPTNLSDATSKCNVGRLSNGTYYLVWNPNPRGERIPLAVALSDDGINFDRMAVLRESATLPRLSGRFKGPGYQYPNALEHEGALHVIHSVNKEDVEVAGVALATLMAL
ncbi:MAG: exo-alpha-sialidase [Anaerolineae bacterium]